ncbi:MAG: hypothetical protein RL172_1394 [Bacteroidota bacterium]|jgi:glucose/arabinose dehydrogenase
MRTFILGCFLQFSCWLAATAQSPELSFTPVIQGLTQPIQVVHANDGSQRLFVLLKGGGIWVYDKNHTLLGTFLTVDGITTNGERGLLSMAFHPDYINNGYFFVFYTNSIGDLQLARYKVSGNNANQANPALKDTVITISHQAYGNHNGGTLIFGKDGYLYLSTGDGGGGGDVANNAQNTSILLGKMLRLQVSVTSGAPYYSIPADNPFGNEVYAYGLRNPFRWSFDKLTGDMWIGDVGQGNWEEINYRPFDSVRGSNFGWRCYEGNAGYNQTTGCTGTASDYVFPVFVYPNPPGNATASVTGGAVYRGDTYINLRGYYIACDYSTTAVFKIKYDSLNKIWDTSRQQISPSGFVNFGETEAGELVGVNINNGTIYHIGSSGPIQYNFNGNGNWSDAANWSNNTVPPAILPAGTAIMINPPQEAVCILDVPVTIPNTCHFTVKNNKRLQINGNLIIQ